MSKVWHSPISKGTKCIVCGRPLRSKSSMKIGIGPSHVKGSIDALQKSLDRGKPIKVKSADDALKLIEQGKAVEMDHDQIGTFLDKLAKIGKEAFEKGTDAPNYNLCLVSVPGTNLFCSENKGIPRINMPQLKGSKIRPGSYADRKLKRGDAIDGEVDIEPEFRVFLQQQGVSVTKEKRPAEVLKATQSELVGAKVGGMMAASEAGKLDLTKPIFISRDGFILDGHHRWAGAVAQDFHTGSKLEMNVEVVDLPISQLIDSVNAFTNDLGVIPKGGADVSKLDASFRHRDLVGGPPCLGC